MKVIYTYKSDNSINRYETIADSTILRSGKPLFLPTLTTSSLPRFNVGLAFRIGRLGKKITQNFAPRYIDAFALCVKMSLQNITIDQIEKDDINNLVDNAITLGEWCQITENDNNIIIGQTRLDYAMSHKVALETIVTISNFSTMKTGDIIIVGGSDLTPIPTINSTIIGLTNDQETLKFRIK